MKIYNYQNAYFCKSPLTVPYRLKPLLHKGYSVSLVVSCCTLNIGLVRGLFVSVWGFVRVFKTPNHLTEQAFYVETESAPSIDRGLGSGFFFFALLYATFFKIYWRRADKQKAPQYFACARSKSLLSHTQGDCGGQQHKGFFNRGRFALIKSLVSRLENRG